MAQTPTMTQSPLYDRVNILSTTSPTEVRFFSVPIGTTDPNGGTAGKTKADTNMQNSSRLSDPESFDVYSIQIAYDLNTAAADINKIHNTSWLELWTGGGQVISWEAPMKIITSGTGYSFNVTNALPQVGYPAPSAIYKFDKPVQLFINENFFVSLKFSAVQSLSAAVLMSCVLGGVHYLVDVVGPDGRSTRRSK